MSLPLIDVACGVLVDGEGRLLIAQRPAGKIAAGKWEFPGGKIEPGETALEALKRELQEELGVGIGHARPLLRFRHEYSDRHVLLDTWLVDRWDGAPQSREQQAFAWRGLDQLGDLDLLPTVTPILGALRLPPHYVFTPPEASLGALLMGLGKLPRGALLRLRLPSLAASDYLDVARTLLPACRIAGLKLILDREPAMVAAIGADFAVLGPVRKTRSHPGVAGIGWQGFAERRGTTALPVYALGGLSPFDLHDARKHGAQGIAAISAYWS